MSRTIAIPNININKGDIDEDKKKQIKKGLAAICYVGDYKYGQDNPDKPYQYHKKRPNRVPEKTTFYSYGSNPTDYV